MSATNTWGALAAERDSLAEVVALFGKFREAMDVAETSIYKADARKAADAIRKELYEKYDAVKPLVEKYARR